MPRIIMHIDMNSYFASVEQQANPFLRGRSVGVCSYLSPGGCIIASSAEAKARGIKTGCRADKARILDPDVVLLENEPAKYRSTTEKIFAILKSYSGTIEPYSGWVSDYAKAACLAREIQSRIKDEVGEWLNCSIGISWTKFLAKFAGDIAPKKGVLTIDSNEKLVEVLRDRPLCDAWGINVRTEARLNILGIKDLLDLRNFREDKIRHSLGRYGQYLWSNVNGIEISQVSDGSPAPKSIGHSYCLPKKTTDKKYLSQVLYKLCEKTGRRLRGNGLEASSMHIGWSYIRDGGYFRSFKTKEKLFTTEEIFRHANQVLEKTQLIMPVRMLAVSVGTLLPVTSQLSLFEDYISKKELSLAIDKINDKYREYTVVRGQMFNTGDMARDRIGFRKIG
ncbi:MAG: polymerase IV protein [Candidatus Falkowbacteria bacterium GW2011_GWF2_38_1205]|nr:MAG: polymerase IV protein [Candidatus Falkowbacteria bacterium GW2011_GWF2_38_1205]